MGSLKRKIARNKASRAKKEIKEQLMMFDKIGDKCDACEKDFDKKSKEQAAAWKVVVREKEKVVRLYCPECWDRANNLISKLKEEINAEQSQF